MTTCGWCNTHYATWRSKCDSCGGSMPPLPGHDPGPPPPEAPRPLPLAYQFRTVFFNLSVILGLAFTLLPMAFFVPLVDQGRWAMAIFPGLFMLGGVSSMGHGWRKAAGIIRAYRYGAAVRGEVDSVRLDTSQSVNQKHPWKLTYHFSVDERLHEGVVTSFDSTLAKLSRGQALWVLYVKTDPSQSTLFPSVRYF